MNKFRFKKTGLAFFLLILLFVVIIFVTKEPDTSVDNATFTDEYSRLRHEMVEQQLKKRDIDDERVLAAIGSVERHKLVPKSLKNKAYNDNPLPIGYGQTISQPYIVALMTQEAGIETGDKVLEIGTGSGYQAAVLAELLDKVYSIEIIKDLADSARQNLKDLGYDNVEVKNADGYYGWEEKGPFDAILVTAAANHVPPPLIEQLKDGGKLVIPLGNVFRFQTLNLITKEGDEVKNKYITSVRFVEMTGQAKEE
jgi:protein-L-isoaspartate(D-aspartate) O-methyltransferase